MTGERRVRKRSKWLQSTTSSAPSSSSASMSHHFNKDSTFLKRIVTEVIAERDAQIAAALFEVAKNQPHLQMMVQTVRPDLPLIFFLSFFLFIQHVFGTQIGHTLSWNSRCYCILKRVRSYRKNGERETYAVQHETTGEPIRLNSSSFVLTSYLCWHRCQREDYICVERKNNKPSVNQRIISSFPPE